MRLVVFLPAYNEAENIGKVLDQIPRSFPQCAIDKVVCVVVDDGSTDETVTIATQHGAYVVQHPRNMGVGKAFNTGLETALKLQADVMVNMDSDGQFSPSEIILLLEPICSGAADFVIGDRFLHIKGYKDKPQEMSWMRYWGNKVIATLVSKLVGKKFTDVSSGFRAYSRKALLNLNLSRDFDHTQESLMDLVFKGLSVVSVPVTVQYFKGRQSRVAYNIFTYGFKLSKLIIRTCRDYKPMALFKFISLPFFLISLGSVIAATFNYSLFNMNYWFLTALSLSIGGLLLFVGFMAESFVHISLKQEKMLVMLKEMKYKESNEGSTYLP